MLEGIDIDLDYKQLMEKLVCSMDNEKCCMLINISKRKCQNCPSSDDLFDYLMDNIHEEEVTYKEWKASKETNTQLVSTTHNVTDFVPKLINLMKKLVTHYCYYELLNYCTLSRFQAFEHNQIGSSMGISFQGMVR
jgi:hypothetical protein